MWYPSSIRPESSEAHDDSERLDDEARYSFGGWDGSAHFVARDPSPRRACSLYRELDRPRRRPRLRRSFSTDRARFPRPSPPRRNPMPSADQGRPVIFPRVRQRPGRPRPPYLRNLAEELRHARRKRLATGAETGRLCEVVVRTSSYSARSPRCLLQGFPIPATGRPFSTLPERRWPDASFLLGLPKAAAPSSPTRRTREFQPPAGLQLVFLNGCSIQPSGRRSAPCRCAGGHRQHPESIDDLTAMEPRPASRGSRGRGGRLRPHTPESAAAVKTVKGDRDLAMHARRRRS